MKLWESLLAGVSLASPPHKKFKWQECSVLNGKPLFKDS